MSASSAARRSSGRSASRSAASSGLMLPSSSAALPSGRSPSSAAWIGRVHLLDGVGGHVVFQRLEHRGALLRAQLVGDVGDVGRVQQAEVAARHAEAHGRGVALRQVDRAPVDEVRLALLGQPVADLGQADAPHDGVAADVDRHDVQIGSRARQLDVVDADHLAAVAVDELLVEEGAAEQQLSVGQRPVRERRRRPRAGACRTLPGWRRRPTPRRRRCVRRLITRAVTRG